MKTLERYFAWLLLVPIALPLLVWPGIIYPYLVPKTLVFYAISLASLALFLVLLTHNTRFYWSRLTQWESWLPGLLFVVACSTSFFGFDMYRSVWSLLVRGDGLLMLGGVVTSFYLILLTADSIFSSRFLRGIAGTGTFVAIYGIGEWIINGGRIGSLLGNAAFFAGYLGIVLWVTLLVAGELGGKWQRVVYAAAVLQIIAIILTATRGTILALLVAGVAYLVGCVYSGGTKRLWATRILGAMLVLGGGLYMLRSQLATLPFEPIARIASVSTVEGNVASRLFIWENTLQAVKPHLLTGIGAEHINVLFNQFYDPTQIVEQWFDRSHNAFLDYLVQYGIVGLLLYGALIVAFLTTAFRLKRSGERRRAGIAALLAVTYTVQNFFVFDTVSSFWLFVTVLAVLLSTTATTSIREDLPLPSWMRPASWVIAIALTLLVYPVSILPAQAAYGLARAYNYQLVDVAKEVNYLSHGYALGTYAGLEYGYQSYDMYANTQAKVLTGQPRLDAYHAALSILKSNFNRYTYDARTALYLAHVLSLAPEGAEIDPALLSSALERALRLSPKRSQPWYILANLSLTNANQFPEQSSERIAGYAAAQDILTQYIKTVPTLSMPHFVLAQLLLAVGKTNAAAIEAEKGRQYYQEDLETASRAAVYYETVVDPRNPSKTDLQNAAYFLSEVVKLDPNNTSAKDDLDKIHAYEQSK